MHGPRQGSPRLATVDFAVIGGGISRRVTRLLAGRARASVLLLEREPFFRLSRHWPVGGRLCSKLRQPRRAKPCHSPAAASSMDRRTASPSIRCYRRADALYLARPDQLAALDRQQADCAPSERLTAAEAVARVPILRNDYVAAGLDDPDLDDIDVDLLHQGSFLRAAHGARAELRTGATVEAIEQRRSGWRVTAAGETHDRTRPSSTPLGPGPDRSGRWRARRRSVFARCGARRCCWSRLPRLRWTGGRSSSTSTSSSISSPRAASSCFVPPTRRRSNRRTRGPKRSTWRSQ